MNNSTADQDSDSEVSYSIIDEHRLLTDQIDAASYVIERFFAAPTNQSQVSNHQLSWWYGGEPLEAV